MKPKTLKITTKDLVEATKTGSKLKEHQDKKLEELIDNAPDLGVQSNDRGVLTETVVMKALRKKGKISASWCFHNLNIPHRTAGYALVRIKNKGHATRKFEKVPAINGALIPTNVYTITQRGKTWIANQK